MKFFVSTGEASGDLHLSYLVKSIKTRYENIEFVGVAGEKSKKEGVEILQNIDELAIMGFVEALKKYKFLKEKAKKYLDYIKENNIKNVILVDYGGFNLKFLELLKKEIKDIKVFYYIPPKVWIWGEKRVEKLRLADYIMVIFPWEVDFYKKHNIDAIYFGNPFTDFYKKVERKGDNILLLPGSRKQELKSILPIFEKIIKIKQEEKFILKLNSTNDLIYTNDLEKYSNLEIVVDKKLKEVVEKSKISIATSGTVTLELALLGLPTIVVYKTTAINYFIAKYILKVGYISLPNLTMNMEVFPELVQADCEDTKIIENLGKILSRKEEVENKIENMRKKLEGEAVIDSYANFLIKEGL